MRILHTVEGIEKQDSFIADASAGGGGWGVKIEGAFSKAKTRQTSKMTTKTEIEVAGIDRD
jgi:hypothetical protein